MICYFRLLIIPWSYNLFYFIFINRPTYLLLFFIPFPYCLKLQCFKTGGLLTEWGVITLGTLFYVDDPPGGCFLLWSFSSFPLNFICLIAIKNCFLGRWLGWKLITCMCLGGVGWILITLCCQAPWLAFIWTKGAIPLRFDFKKNVQTFVWWSFTKF